jgi:osmotically-inducible protein OsmY
MTRQLLVCALLTATVQAIACTGQEEPRKTTTQPISSGVVSGPVDDKEDARITAELRKAIKADEAMSVNAQNCKIVTSQGVVTLSGMVDSPAEKESIAAKASAIAGVKRVENQLDVKHP